jgi:hypothetical protein
MLEIEKPPKRPDESIYNGQSPVKHQFGVLGSIEFAKRISPFDNGVVVDIFCHCDGRDTVIIRVFDVVFPTLRFCQVDGLCKDTSRRGGIGDKELSIVLLSARSLFDGKVVADISSLNASA